MTAPAEPGAGYDVVSRFFAPGSGIPEDPTTGSAHCILAPFWSARLGRRGCAITKPSQAAAATWSANRGATVC